MSSSTNYNDCTRSIRRNLPLLRVFLALVLFFLLLYRAPLPRIASAFRTALTSPRILSGGFVLVGLALLTGAMRWHLLLRAQQLGISLSDAIRYFFSGQFFNVFLPGGCGGDLIRMYWVARRFPGRRTSAVGTVVLDRVLGLYFYIAAACLFIGTAGIPGLPDAALAATRVAAVLLLGASLAVWTLVLVRPTPLQKAFSDPPGSGDEARGMPLIRALARSASLYLHRPLVILGALALSALNFGLLAVACVCFSHSLNLPISLLRVLAAFAVATLIGALPLTPGAIGLREGTYVLLLQPAGVSASGALALGLLMYFAGALWGLPGALVFATEPTRSPRELAHRARAFLRGGLCSTGKGRC